MGSREEIKRKERRKRQRCRRERQIFSRYIHKTKDIDGIC